MVDSTPQDRIGEALHYLSEQFSVTRDEWRRHFRGGDMLLDGAVSRGFVREQGGRYAVTETGRRRINATGVLA